MPADADERASPEDCDFCLSVELPSDAVPLMLRDNLSTSGFSVCEEDRPENGSSRAVPSDVPAGWFCRELPVEPKMGESATAHIRVHGLNHLA